MPYCQVCDEPHLMVPDGGVVRCPECDHTEALATTRPLFVVTGASGSGKSTLLPLLLERLAGRCMVFDADWLIDPFARAAHGGDLDWPSLRDAWLYVAHAIAQNGLVTLLLGPFFPAQLDDLAGRAGIGDIHYLVLDCPDDERRRRIDARPRWRRRDVEQQTDFARWLRSNLAPVIDTSKMTPAETADAVVAWVDSRSTAGP
jgi:hypothetical protein